MTRTERRLLVDTSVLGVLLTALVITIDFGGLLGRLESFFYDFRARHFQFFTPPPTDRLVHLDIDDPTLEAVGAWPWPRSKLADIVDEINLTGCKALAMDVIFSEPQPPGFEEPISAAGAPTTQPGQLRPVDHDARFAEALKRFGRAIVPVSLNLYAQPIADPLYKPLLGELTRDLELDVHQLTSILQSKGYQQPDLARQVTALYLTARREAMYERIAAEMGSSDISTAELRRRLLPRTDPDVSGSPLIRLLENQAERHRAVRSLRRFARPFPADLPRLLETRDEQATLRILSQAAGSSGFVDYVRLSDGVVRMVPLFANHRDYMFPQMGLALACAMLDVPMADVRVTPEQIILPVAGGDIVIPVRTALTQRGRFGMFFDIPWFGTEDWETMYDFPNHVEKKQHISLSYVWEAVQMRQRIARNNQSIDEAISVILGNDQEYKLALDPAKAKAYFAAVPAPEDIRSREAIVASTLKELTDSGWIEAYEKTPAAQLSATERFQLDTLRSARKALTQGLEQNRQYQRLLDGRRADLKERLHGKAVLLGWVAVGTIADRIPTSLHASCPGVVAHGVIFNSIMTGDFWRTAPAWLNMLITVVLGLATTGVVALFPPWRALATTILLTGGYCAFNALYVFDYGNLVLGVAGPLSAILLVWAGGTLARYILEAGLRAKIKRRFENYVDPMLVNYVLEHDARLDGQVKELTVAFTDLAGFTSISEQLKEKTVPLLNEYIGLMVPVIRKRRGYVNKFLGDGIMFFCGAPMENAIHAYDALAAVLEMLEVMHPFNQSLEERGLPRLSVRAGIASGEMVVGDAGPSEGGDYTVLGDNVNLAARLEPANKVFGTRILMNDRARELVGDRILCRPIGRIQVVGKKQGVLVHEAMSLIESATAEQKALAEMTQDMVQPFMSGEFDRCREAIVAMESRFGVSRLTTLYRELCEGYLKESPEAGFNGQIVLTAK